MNQYQDPNLLNAFFATNNAELKSLIENKGYFCITSKTGTFFINVAGPTIYKQPITPMLFFTAQEEIAMRLQLETSKKSVDEKEE